MTARRRRDARRVLDAAALVFLGALAIYNVVVAELAGNDGRYAEGTFDLIHGLLFFAVFTGFRWAVHRRRDDLDE